MTVYDLCGLYLEQSENVEIWSTSYGQTLFDGTFEDAADSGFEDCDVMSFHVEDGIVVITV